MFVGHYAAGLALKSVEKRASLGVLFLAVQFVDILFFPFVLMGIERLNVVEGYTESTHFELIYYPYTHSLLAALLWGAAAYALFRWVVVRKHSVALVMAMAVMSHWLLDLIVHTPDLPLWTDASPKVGLGLWNNAIGTWLLEAALLVTGAWLYLRATVPRSKVGRYGMGVFVTLLLALNAVNLFGPLTNHSKVAMVVQALAAFFVIAGIAFWLDTKRD